MSMPAMAKSTMLCTPRSAWRALSFFSISKGATSSPSSMAAIASISVTIGFRLLRPIAKR